MNLYGTEIVRRFLAASPCPDGQDHQHLSKELQQKYDGWMIKDALSNGQGSIWILVARPKEVA